MKHALIYIGLACVCVGFVCCLLRGAKADDKEFTFPPDDIA